MTEKTSKNSSMNSIASTIDSSDENDDEATTRIERSAALTRLALNHEEERSGRENDEKYRQKSASVVARPVMLNAVKLMVGGEIFEVEKETLLIVKNTYFHGMLSSGSWQPDADGAYTIHRSALGFDRVVEYLRSGKLPVYGMSKLEEECLYSHLDYFLIPYRRNWQYNTQSLIVGFKAEFVVELEDGRLCGEYENDIIVWNLDSNAIDMLLKGHTDLVRQVIQLKDGRVCSCSEDRTIKVWSLESGLCELTLIGHTSDVMSIIQLFDSRLISCSGDDDDDESMRVWNISTGECEITTITEDYVCSIVQLADGLICCGLGEVISIYSLESGEFVLSSKFQADVTIIVCIDATRICSCSYGNRAIKVWNIATGECERTLGYTDPGTSIVLMHDGRLCSAFSDGTIKLWNLDTGECEKTLKTQEHGYFEVLQLSDGRLVTSNYDGEVHVIF